MIEKLTNLSAGQKELLVKKIMQIKGSPNEEGPFSTVFLERPFGYEIQFPNFHKIRCKNFDASPPGPYQVQIRAKAISLNFRDIMIGLGLYPMVDGIPTLMGGDYSGVVVACGKYVDNFKVGDEVISLYGGDDKSRLHFSNHINSYTPQTILKPQSLSFQEACCIPTAFLTSYIGLHQLGNLSKNETVLIHTASGGVGMAAIQVARWKEATIFATAGSDEKRTFLKSFGIANVMNSRTLDFFDEILTSTSGRGVDVVLNTLSGEAVEKGMQLLTNFGRFVQLDKTDIFKKRPINLDLFKKATSFIYIDLSLFHMNTRLEGIFQEVCDLFSCGIFSPLPFKVFCHTDLASALNFMTQGKHTGKIVISFEP